MYVFIHFVKFGKLYSCREIVAHSVCDMLSLKLYLDVNLFFSYHCFRVGLSF